MAGANVVKGVVRFLRASDVPRAKDDPVWLRLGEELADGFEALETWVRRPMRDRARRSIPIRRIRPWRR